MWRRPRRPMVTAGAATASASAGRRSRRRPSRHASPPPRPWTIRGSRCRGCGASSCGWRRRATRSTCGGRSRRRAASPRCSALSRSI
ncbi:hypothetical protein Ctob_009112, partial [Chrysochromulina tobinii]